jgi:hypothetical protein
MSELIQFSFKGDRNYVHGTSLFDALVRHAEHRGIKSGRINILFKQKIDSPECILEERIATTDDSVVAKLLSFEGCSHSFCINPVSKKQAAVIVDYDESDICLGAKVGCGSIIQNQPRHDNKIELLVALCKKMHFECIESEKKWVFARYDGVFPIPEINQVEIRIAKQVGTRLTCSDVLINGRKIADMYFS